MLAELPIAPSSEKFHGYELLHPSITNAVINLLQRMNLGDHFFSAESIQRNSIVNGNERYIGASLDWLSIGGYIKYNGDKTIFSLTESGKKILSNALIISQTVETYDAIVHLTERALRWDHEVCASDLDLQQVEEGVELGEQYQLEAILPAAIAAFAEIRNEQGESIAEKLQRGEVVDLQSVVNTAFDQPIFLFVKALEQLELIEKVAEGYQATDPKGKKMFAISGGAELITSYFSTLQRLYELAIEELNYGLHQEVNRHGRLNANASNRIIEQRVIPHILETIFHDVPVVSEILERGHAAFLDYGSGGGENIVRVLAAEERVQAAYGLDISGLAIAAAQDNVAVAGKSNQANFIQGSIARIEDLQRVRSAMEEAEIDPTQNLITAVSAIMHDIGPALARDFLTAHKNIFPNAPIIVTENFKVSQGVLEMIPAYQPVYFQFLHQISGQHLYSESEFSNLLAECGYDVVSEQAHASVPDMTQEMDANGKYPRIATAVTWVIVPIKSE